MAGKVAMSIAGRMAKYFATSLAMLKVVSAPGHQKLFPISTISISFVGLLSRSTMLPASRGLRPGIHGHADIRLGKRRGVVGAIAGHGDQASGGLLFPDAFQFSSGVA